VPRQRADQGSTRAIPAHVVDLLCQLKDDEPALTIPLLIKRVREQHHALVSDEVTLAESTVHRLLASRGLMRKAKDEPTNKDRRRFEHPRLRRQHPIHAGYKPQHC
jgi:putative transposase